MKQVPLALVWAALLLAGSAAADNLHVIVRPIATSPTAHETTPTIGNDGVTDLVVYTHNAIVGGLPRPGDIKYQRITPQGMPIGAAIRVSDDLGETTDNRLNDVSGKRIVYTAVDPSSNLGMIRMYNLQDGSTLDLLEEPDAVREARIHGDTVAWVQGSSGSTRIEMVDLQSLGSPITLSGANPAIEVDVGSRYVVWEEHVGGNDVVVAYDLTTEELVDVASSEVEERSPATFGDWIVWQQTDIGVSRSIWAWNAGAAVPGPPIQIASTPWPNQVQAPSIDGGLIVRSGNAGGSFDTYVYRLVDGSTHQMTFAPTHQILNDVFGSLVGFVDGPATGTFYGDVHVAHLTFAPEGAFFHQLDRATVDGNASGGAGCVSGFDTSLGGWLPTLGDPFANAGFVVFQAPGVASGVLQTFHDLAFEREDIQAPPACYVTGGGGDAGLTTEWVNHSPDVGGTYGHQFVYALSPTLAESIGVSVIRLGPAMAAELSVSAGLEVMRTRMLLDTSNPGGAVLAAPIDAEVVGLGEGVLANAIGQRIHLRLDYQEVSQTVAASYSVDGQATWQSFGQVSSSFPGIGPGLFWATAGTLTGVPAIPALAPAGGAAIAALLLAVAAGVRRRQR